MSVGEKVLLIGLLINALAIVLAAWINSRKLDIAVTDVLNTTSSLKDELVDVTKAAALLQGNIKGRADLKAEQSEENDASGAHK